MCTADQAAARCRLTVISTLMLTGLALIGRCRARGANCLDGDVSEIRISQCAVYCDNCGTENGKAIVRYSLLNSAQTSGRIRSETLREDQISHNGCPLYMLNGTEIWPLGHSSHL